MDGKHVRSDISILSKTTIYIPDGVMDAYFMLFNYRALFQLLFGKNGEIDIFLMEWLEHIFSNRELYIIQQDDDRTFLAQVLHCINQSIHLYLKSCSKSSRADVRDQLQNHDEKRNLIEQRNFNHRLPSAIKSIFLSTDKENEKEPPDDSGKKGGGKRKFTPDDDKNFGQRIDNKAKELQKFKLRQSESFQPFYDKQRDCPKFKEGLPCMKFLLKGHCHTKCNRMHSLDQNQQQEFSKFVSDVREFVKQANQDFQQGAVEEQP
jgi:hypothetical protein